MAERAAARSQAQPARYAQCLLRVRRCRRTPPGFRRRSASDRDRSEARVRIRHAMDGRPVWPRTNAKGRTTLGRSTRSSVRPAKTPAQPACRAPCRSPVRAVPRRPVWSWLVCPTACVRRPIAERRATQRPIRRRSPAPVAVPADRTQRSAGRRWPPRARGPRRAWLLPDASEILLVVRWIASHIHHTTSARSRSDSLTPSRRRMR